MIPEMRRRLLLDRLKDVEILSIAELSDSLGVSQMTVRRDIRALENEGHVVAVSGGVKSASRLLREPPYVAKMRSEIGFKRGIARAAAELVKDDHTIFIDAGTTAFQLAPLITTRKNLTVVTNDFNTVAMLMDYPQIELFHTGGRVEHHNRSTFGMSAAAFLTNMNFDLAFISTPSWDLKHGVTTPEQAKVLFKRNAMAAASQSILLADSTKHGRFGKFKVADLEQFDYVITDDRLPQSDGEAIKRLSVRLIMAPGDRPERSGRNSKHSLAHRTRRRTP